MWRDMCSVWRTCVVWRDRCGVEGQVWCGGTCVVCGGTCALWRDMCSVC